MAGHDQPRPDGDQPSVQTPPGWDELPLLDAAERLGLTTKALRKRIQRGSVPGHKRDGQWYAVLPPQGERRDASSHPRLDGAETAVAGHTVQGPDSDQTPPSAAVVLRDEVAFLRSELEARRREVEQLHTLLAQAQQLALPPPGAPVERLDTEQARQDKRPDATPLRRSWWKFWLPRARGI